MTCNFLNFMRRNTMQFLFISISYFFVYHDRGSLLSIVQFMFLCNDFLWVLISVIVMFYFVMKHYTQKNRECNVTKTWIFSGIPSWLSCEMTFAQCQFLNKIINSSFLINARTSLVDFSTTHLRLPPYDECYKWHFCEKA